MTKELCFIIEQLSREKGIPKEMLIATLESALLSAARKKYGGRTNVNLRIDPKTCAITVFETKKIVETVNDKNEEITVEDAAKISPGKLLGDEVEVPIFLQDFGRIAAQTAKQVIFQRVREAERDVIFKEYKDKVGRVISGVVMRKERGMYFLNIGKTEALLLQKESLPGENLKRGDTVRAYIEDVRVTPKGPVIYLSRTNPKFVLELFVMEVPEISEGLVVIKNIVREPGERTKIAVFSKDHTIDPVGACVGMKGTRVQSIVRELRGERIDIIPWTDDPRILISRALSPATVDKIGINEEEKTAMVVVNDQQLSLAIGKKGQNVKLAMKLTGWDIDILSDSEYSKMRSEESDAALPDSLRKESPKTDKGSGKSENSPE
ncbi:MAG: transcription termination factor NusA [Nitrospirae bacterium]|nr:transcription termination factor NusA [Nitrospirota bacterium]MCL5420954.1 transcription termination factor NusA [Nitrospirota bacterium]